MMSSHHISDDIKNDSHLNDLLDNISLTSSDDSDSEYNILEHEIKPVSIEL